MTKRCKSTSKKSTQIQWKSSEIHSEAHTTSSHMPLPPRTRPLYPSARKEVVCASLWFSINFPEIWVDFLHMDSHLYPYSPQSIYRTQVLTDKVGLSFFQCLRLSSSYLQCSDILSKFIILSFLTDLSVTLMIAI